MWASRISHFIGVSGGALAAAVCAFQPESELIARFAEESGVRGLSWAKILGSLEVSAPALRGEDGSAHGAFTLSDEDVRAVSGRRILFLGATQCDSGRPTLLCHFRSRHELAKGLLASCAIPRSAHPFDLLRGPRSPPTYPENDGVIIRPDCEWDPQFAEGADGAPPYGRAFVDGGLTSAAPLAPASLQVHTVTISPFSGPQGVLNPGGAPQLVAALQSVDVVDWVLDGRQRDCGVRTKLASAADITCREHVARSDAATPAHLHLCPMEASVRFPLIAPRLAGMRCFLSVANLLAFSASVGAPPSELRRWYQRGVEDAMRFETDHAPPES